MENLRDAIFECKFSALLARCANIDDTEQIGGDLVTLSIDEQDIRPYYCLCYLIENVTDNEIKASLHDAASLALTLGLPFVNGAYHLAYHHKMKAIELMPNSIEYKKAAILTFHNSVDVKVDPLVERQLALDILKIDPTDSVGLEFSQEKPR